MIYKGYTGVTEVDEDSGELFGTVIGLRDVITFVGRSVDEARKSFEESIDYYLKSCQETGKQPDPPFTGQFLVRIDPETHRGLATLAAIHKISLNDVVAQALKEFANNHRLLAEEAMRGALSSDSLDHHVDLRRMAPEKPKSRSSRKKIG
jgi:predicted HicB family RNase H-like nuclease